MNDIDKKKSPWWPMILLFAGVFILWLLSWKIYILIPDWFLGSFPSDAASQGQFGDSFGAINALFSGLAFAGLIYTIILQREELKAQREELKITREEISGQKKALEEQSATLKKQNFENALFSIIGLHQKIIDGIEINDRYGKNALRIIYKKLKNNFEMRNHGEKSHQYYAEIYNGHQPYLSVYFRTLYRCFKYIEDNENLNIPNYDSYHKALRAQLTDAEICLLYYNCTMTDAGFKFRKYIEKYALLDNFDPLTLLEPLNEIHLVPEITEKAWGKTFKELETIIQNGLRFSL